MEVKFLSDDEKKYVQRNAGLDVFRCIMMLFIVIHHATVHGLGLYQSDKLGVAFLQGSLLNSFAVVGVNGFFLLSGYFTVKFSLKKFIRLHFQAVYYGLLSYMFFVVLGIVDFDKILFIKSIILPELFYWYMMVYCILILFSKPINSLLDVLDKQTFITYLAVYAICEILGLLTGSEILGFNDGYSVIHGIFMYSIGLYLSKYPIDIIKRKGFCIYIITCLTNCICVWGGVFLFTGVNRNLSSLICSYNNPLIVFGAVALFCFFIDFNIKNKKMIHFISCISGSTLTVYLITDHMGVQKSIYLPIASLSMYVGTKWYWICNIIYAAALFILCVLVDNFRKQIKNLFQRS